MAQSDADIGITDLVSSYDAFFNNLRAAIRSMWSGATAPSSPVLGQLWLDTNTPSTTEQNISIYDGANWVVLFILDTATHAITLGAGITEIGAVTATGILNMGGFKIENLATPDSDDDATTRAFVTGREFEIRIEVGAQSAAFDRFAFVGTAKLQLVAAYVLVGTTVAADGANYWSFKLRNLTAAVDLANFNTSASALTADALTSLGTISNSTPANLDVVQLQVTKTGGPTALDAETVVFLRYKVTA